MNHPILLPEHIKMAVFKGVNKAFYLTIRSHKFGFIDEMSIIENRIYV